MSLFLKILKWAGISILIAYAAVVVYRMFFLWNKQKTDAEVAKIHATKLTLDDVMGKNLPPDPGADADKTVQGIDANHNGIRDDVELAIFKLHPDSARIREAELQYATELQTKLVQVFNSETWLALVKYEKGVDCLVDVSFDKYTDIKDQLKASDVWQKEVRDIVLNTQSRISREKDVDKYQTSFATGTKNCEIDLKQLPN